MGSEWALAPTRTSLSPEHSRTSRRGWLWPHPLRSLRCLPQRGDALGKGSAVAIAPDQSLKASTSPMPGSSCTSLEVALELELEAGRRR